MSILTADRIQRRQQWVKDHPCRAIHECGLLGYRADLKLPGLHLATVLTIDLFNTELPLAWRAQIGVIKPDQHPARRSQWTVPQTIEAYNVAKLLLNGVGIEAGKRVEQDQASFTLIYPCTADEAEHVTRAALRPSIELPAIAVGEVNEYDFSDRSTQIAGWWDAKEGQEKGLYLPQQRKVIYGRQN